MAFSPEKIGPSTAPGISRDMNAMRSAENWNVWLKGTVEEARALLQLTPVEYFIRRVGRRSREIAQRATDGMRARTRHSTSPPSG